MARISLIALPLCAVLLMAPSAFAAAKKQSAKPAVRTAASSSKTAKTSSNKTHGNTAAPTAAAKTRTVSTSKSRKGSKASPKPPKLRGQQAIDSARVSEIQQALIREHYMNGTPSGSWDNESQAAMRKFQADQGWQTKLTPDSRALKKLGLGPDYSTAINAQGANFAPPPPPSTIPAEVNAGFTDASGVKTN